MTSPTLTTLTLDLWCHWRKGWTVHYLMLDAPINPRVTGLCTIFNPLYTGSLLSLGSGVLFGLLLAIGATQTTANRGNFSLLLGKETYTSW